MSVAEMFLTTAKQFLLATENIKRLDEKVQALSTDVSAMDRRLIRLETFIEIGTRQQTTHTPQPPKKLKR